MRNELNIMIKNSYRIKKEGQQSGPSFFSFIEQKLRMEELFEEGVPSKYLPHVLFVAALIIFYIGNNHYAEKTIRKIEKAQVEVEELRADYTSLKADYMFASKQSEVAKKVEKIGLEESKTPPHKIVVHKSEY